jgi:hypothetical protein
LLWSSDNEEGFVLTSVGKRNVLDFKEVPAVGIFLIDMNSSGKNVDGLCILVYYLYNRLKLIVVNFLVSSCYCYEDGLRLTETQPFSLRHGHQKNETVVGDNTALTASQVAMYATSLH